MHSLSSCFYTLGYCFRGFSSCTTQFSRPESSPSLALPRARRGTGRCWAMARVSDWLDHALPAQSWALHATSPLLNSSDVMCSETRSAVLVPHYTTTWVSKVTTGALGVWEHSCHLSWCGKTCPAIFWTFLFKLLWNLITWILCVPSPVLQTISDLFNERGEVLWMDNPMGILVGHCEKMMLD